MTTLLIPPAAYREGGEANGRALAYLAHHYLGNAVGSIYDVSTILILAFAGASAMAGLLNLIPRYLPRFGMAPEWARAARPLVLVFMAVAFAVTYLFHADVDAQGGAYATGVLVLITSAAIAVSLSVWHKSIRWAFLLTALVFTYTTLVNIFERPEGIKIACVFIFAMVVLSVISRALRSTELRITGIRLTPEALELLGDDDDQVMRIVALRPKAEQLANLDILDGLVRFYHSLTADECLCFFEVERGDASDFEKDILVTGVRVGRHRILRAKSPVVANAPRY